MPIIIEDFDDLSFSTSPAAKITPKFFSAALTGSGGAVGLLNKNLRPGRYRLGQSRASRPVNVIDTKVKTTHNSVTVHAIPFSLLTRPSVHDNVGLVSMSLPLPSPTDRFEVTAGKTALAFDVFVDLTVHGATIAEDGSGDKVHRELDVLYRMEVFVVPHGFAGDTAMLVTAPLRPGFTDAFAMIEYSFAPLDDIEELITRATAAVVGRQNGVHVDQAELALWMSEFDVHEHVVRQALVWNSEDAGELIAGHIEQVFAAGTPSNEVLNRLVRQLRFLETYQVSLASYRAIHHALATFAPADIAETLSKQNVNLLMDHTLGELEQLKPQLVVPPPAQSAPGGRFSTQQLTAVTTDEPLVLVQAGAGTGKSTVILGRIQHLMDRGVDPRDITVLSFTNAAADNISAKNPAVGSMTIARMIHDIYTLNFPSHKLSSVDTIINSLDIFFPSDDVAREFRRYMLNVKKNHQSATTELNAFVEHNYDAVMLLLDRIQQTCLELEIIVAYQKIDVLVEPPHVMSRFLIIDEVQDNSVFEFIYVLKYVAKHAESLFIVGDASQTLYEFRSSNPKALNALEESGVFATYQLTTNYRSNQEILDFANVHLANIEANQAAGLQLQANMLGKPTADTFRNKVNLKVLYYPALRGFRDDLPGYVINVMGPYIDACLARGERVAFLAHAREDVSIVERQLRAMYPNLQIANIVTERSQDTTVFSQFVKEFWDTIVQLTPDKAPFGVSQGIVNNLHSLSRNVTEKTEKAVRLMVSDWWTESTAVITGWVALWRAGQKSADQFFEDLRTNVLDFEISRNSARQAMLNLRNRERKQLDQRANAEIVVSTIHGAKGLEFDNVIVLHKDDATPGEDVKRMHYVAFTRAMNTELILSYGNVRKPRIESDYLLIEQQLVVRDELDKLRAQGVDLEAMDDDEAGATLAAIRKMHEESESKAVVRMDAVPATRGSGTGDDDEDDTADDKSAFVGATV